MIDTKTFMESLMQKGYENVISVPCSFLKYPINYAVNQGIYLPVCNEGEAVAIGAGMQLAGRKSVVFMQNSGLGNAVSPLSSLNYIFDIPCLMFIGYRGSDTDEPQHELMGQITEELLQSLRIRYEVLSEDTQQAIAQMEQADAYMEKEGRSFCLLVKRDRFSAVALESKAEESAQLIRSELLEVLAKTRDENTLIVTTTGFTSRELYQLADDDKNFYMVGSMGCASSIGLGLAIARPDKKVIVVEGDGAFLMRPSILPVISEQRPKNFLHVVLENETYESTGKQPIPEKAAPVLDLMKLTYEGNVQEITSPEGFENQIQAFLTQPSWGSLFGKIRSQSIDGLGRPKHTMREVAARFRKELAK